MTRTEYHVVYSSNGNTDMHFGYLPEEHTDVISAYKSAFHVTHAEEGRT